MNYLTKILLCLSSVYLIAQATSIQDDPTQDLQDLYNGFFEQANLSDPTTVLGCYDSNTTILTLDFLGKIFSELANNQVIQAAVTLQQYENQVPYVLSLCLQQNIEIENVKKAYNIQGKNFVQLASGIIKLVATQYSQVHTDLVALNSDYQQGQYDQSGKIVGQLIQQAFQAANIQDDPTQDLQELYNGFFEQASLSDPTTVLGCYDSNTTILTLDFLGKIFSELANNQVIQAAVTLQQYENQVPYVLSLCLQQNIEIENVKKAYNIQGKNFVQLASGIIKLVATQYSQVHTNLVALNSDYQQGQYDQSGKIVGQLIQQAFPSYFNDASEAIRAFLG